MAVWSERSTGANIAQYSLEHARFSKHSGHAGSLNLPVFKKAKHTAYDFFAEKFRMAKS